MTNNNDNIPVKSKSQRILSIVIILSIIFLGISFAKYLIATKPKISKKKLSKMTVPVEVKRVKKTNSNIELTAIGSVIPAKELLLKPLVSGDIVYINPKLVPGTIINKGEIAIKIDKSDYLIQKKVKEANLKVVLSDYEIEKGQQIIAKNEWEMIKNSNINNDSISFNDTPDLALRKPQLEKMKAKIAIAEAELRQAELNLKRTNVLVPFNAIVSEKYVDVGSNVNNQTNIVKLIGKDEFWIKIMVPTSKLNMLDIISLNSKFPKVSISYLNKSNNITYEGKIIKFLTNVDEKGLMATFLISVKNPLDKKYKIPLLLGSQVKVRIKGKELNSYYRLPRYVLYNDNNILIAKDDVLEIRKVKVDYVTKDWVYIKENINDNEKVVFSRVPAPIDKMPIKIIKELK